ncbi:nidogen-like domain-containing protein [Roseisolibacter agri]|uniref:PEP-CTERM motif protein n=1 Tax=Roseisolibacter agri TaxID=2014610 RepID=A0AA37VG07_9BACT|nr:nidogen-like domain-containing protein [Roseisolibacter agri]GLC27704.1 hypothetical protein rosag_42170 [Roseisolibacter agri]
MVRTPLRSAGWCLALLLAASPVALAAQTIRPTAGFTTNTLARNDDGSTAAVPLGWSYNFFGITGNSVFVNNNGNITFDSGLSDFTPEALNNRRIIAPFWADVDTRPLTSGITTYGTGTLDGRNAFYVNWPGVGYYNQHADKLNTFQLFLIDRNDTGVGNFDFEFNYGSIQWDAGDLELGAGSAGRGAQPGADCARAGYSNGSGVVVELPGSGVCGALVDGGSNALSVLGRAAFQVRAGQVQQEPPTGGPGGSVVPEPSTYVLMATGLLGLVGVARSRRRA